MKKSISMLCAAICSCNFNSFACTGIALTAKDGSYIQARTIENADIKLPSEYVIIPRGQDVILAGDAVVVVNKGIGLQDISDGLDR